MLRIGTRTRRFSGDDGVRFEDLDSWTPPPPLPLLLRFTADLLGDGKPGRLAGDGGCVEEEDRKTGDPPPPPPVLSR